MHTRNAQLIAAVVAIACLSGAHVPDAAATGFQKVCLGHAYFQPEATNDGQQSSNEDRNSAQMLVHWFRADIDNRIHCCGSPMLKVDPNTVKVAFASAPDTLHNCVFTVYNGSISVYRIEIPWLTKQALAGDILADTKIAVLAKPEWGGINCNGARVWNYDFGAMEFVAPGRSATLWGVHSDNIPADARIPDSIFGYSPGDQGYWFEFVCEEGRSGRQALWLPVIMNYDHYKSIDDASWARYETNCSVWRKAPLAAEKRGSLFCKLNEDLNCVMLPASCFSTLGVVVGQSGPPDAMVKLISGLECESGSAEIRGMDGSCRMMPWTRDSSLTTAGRMPALSVTSQQASPSPEDLARGQELMGKAAQAVGGKMIAGLKGYHKKLKLTVSSQGTSLDIGVEETAFFPDRMRVTQTTPFGSMTQVVAGVAGWAESPRGVQDLSDDDLAEAREGLERECVRVLRDHAQLTCEALDPTDVDGRRLECVRVTGAGKEHILFYLDPVTFLPAIEEKPGKSPVSGGPVTERTLLADYGDFGGFKLARSVTIQHNGETFAAGRLELFEANPAVKTESFEKP